MELFRRIAAMMAPALLALALAGAGAALADDSDASGGDNGVVEPGGMPMPMPSPMPPEPPPCRPGETCPGYIDADGDGWDDYSEASLGSDPNNAASTPEHAYAGTCDDGADNDLDGATDLADDGCNVDSDGDGLPDHSDNCPWDPNADQADSDGDGIGDACDHDQDNDGFDDFWETEVGSDPADPNSTPETAWMPETCYDGADNDLDGAADGDDAGCTDVCPPLPVPGPLPPEPPSGDMDGVPCPTDYDGDGIAEADDNCPFSWNPDQADSDGDGTGDACEDSDGDGWMDSDEQAFGSDPLDANSTPEQWWVGDSCYDGADNDLDGAADADDDACAVVCPGPVTGPPASAPEPMPPDRGNGVPPSQECDYDADDDGYDDFWETDAGSDPNDPNSTPEHAWMPETCSDGTDNDLDGATDMSDEGCNLDSDGDGLPDVLDNCPYDPNADQADDDGDGLGNACDYDADNDFAEDWLEEMMGSDPNDPNSTPEHSRWWESCGDGLDNDLDGTTDAADPGCQPDTDGDMVPDTEDNCPDVYNSEQTDSDGDGTGDACEDSDGDGFYDLDEAYWGSDPNDAGSTPEVFWAGESCADGRDNDGDGAIDSDDEGCRAFWDGPPPMPSPATRAVMWGDMDCDGSVAIGDAQKVALFLVGMAFNQTPPCFGMGSTVRMEGAARTWGDVDGNGAVTIGDAQKIARWLVGLPVERVAGCPVMGEGVRAPGH